MLASVTQTVLMRVTLRLTLEAPVDAVWEALHSPAVFRAVSGPVTTADSLEPGGFPQRWSSADHRVRLRLLGIVPMGTQRIRLRDEELDDTTRVVHDEGGPLTGAMRVVRAWHHRMAISPDPAAPDARTQFLDTLELDAGVFTLFAWLGFWGFWRLRGRRLRQRAPDWAQQFGRATC